MIVVFGMVNFKVITALLKLNGVSMTCGLAMTVAPSSVEEMKPTCATANAFLSTNHVKEFALKVFFFLQHKYQYLGLKASQSNELKKQLERPTETHSCEIFTL